MTVPNQPLIPPAGVRVYETELSIPTYDYEGALVPSQPDDPIYPYPRLNAGRVGGKSLRRYRAVVLENAYVRVTILPELGGRVYAWLDKSSGQALAYSNPVIKPTHWGYRGWWLATGGMEWCLPTDEHGLNEYRPWQTTLGGASVTVSDHEDRTGLDVQVTLSLDNVHSSLIVQPRIANGTGSPQSFKFWINAMLAFGGNRVGPSTRTIMPTGQATIHSSSDSHLPGAGAVIDWPVYNGRDVSVVGQLDGWLGVFASPRAQAGFAGAYDEAAGLGIVRIFPAHVATGVKFFSAQGIDPATWTDDGSTYLELWGGLTPTFTEDATIESGQTWSWTERWYPVSGLEGAYDEANATAALRLRDRGSSVYAGIAANANLANARIRLWQTGQVAAEWSTSLGPGRPVSVVWQRPAGGCQGEACGQLGLQVLDSAGSVLAQTGLTTSP
ncbi:MAG: DUF5107 domain-containing protein [Thermoflexales bacterium]|nr:DUF5107 domain-containing protein [Thermoflexales bacterium]